MWQEQELDSTRLYYPDAAWLEPRAANRISLTMDPLPERSTLKLVLGDLRDRGQVGIGRQGKLLHSAAYCGRPSDQHPEVSVTYGIPRRTYIVHVALPEARFGEGGSVHPHTRVVGPEISLRTYPNHPHMFGEVDACPISPHDEDWGWDKGGLLGYLDQVAIWVVKTEAWFWSGWPSGRSRVWLGSDSSHAPQYLLDNLAAQGPCWCGSGRRYQACHRRADVARTKKINRAPGRHG